MRPVAAEIRPADQSQQIRSQAAHEIHQRMQKASAGARSIWPHQAQAISDMRACKGWKDLGYESFAEWITQPEIAMDGGTSWARKLAGMLEAFQERKFNDLEALGECPPSNLAITVKRVRSGEVTPEQAIADSKSMHREQLEVRYSSDPDAALDADTEPEKWKCPTCRKVYEQMPKHLRDDDDDDTPDGDSYQARGVDDDAGTGNGEVF